MDELKDNFEIVGRIVRDDVRELLVKTGVYWKIPVIDIRWSENDKLTRKGIRVNRKEAKKLLEILKDAIEKGEDKDED